MIPLADDVSRTRTPLVTLVTWVAADVAALVALLSGEGAWTALLLLACGLWIWVFGRSVEDRIGPLWLGLLGLAGGAGAAMLGIAAGMDDRLAAAAATGIAFEVVAAHRIRFPQARILSLSLVPYYAGLVMTPAWLWVLLGASLGVALGAAGAFGG